MATSTDPPAIDAPAGTARLLLIDDHKMFAESLLRLLASTPGLEVVGTEDSLAAGLVAVAALRPDVVLLDHGLPDGTAPASVHRVLAAYPDTKVIILTALNDDATFAAALEGGVSGFVTKDRAASELVDAVRRVAADGTAFPEPMLVRAVERLRSTPRSIATLSDREHEVLALLGHGRSSKEIAAELFVSVNTVRNHVQSILQKLDAHSRHEAVAIGFRAGLIDVDEGFEQG